MYDPAVGRFLTEDPIGFSGDPSNVYRYVKNNPLTYTDPSGLAATEPVLVFKGNNWAAGEKTRITDSVNRILKRLAELIAAAKKEYDSLTECKKKGVLGKDLTNFRKMLDAMSSEFMDGDKIIFEHLDLGAAEKGTSMQHVEYGFGFDTNIQLALRGI